MTEHGSAGPAARPDAGTAGLARWIVVATFLPGTVMAEVFAVAEEEMAAVAALQAAGRIGTVHLSLARGTVFLETFAAGEDDARAVIGSLPMARWWRLDPYPVAPPPMVRA